MHLWNGIFSTGMNQMQIFCDLSKKILVHTCNLLASFISVSCMSMTCLKIKNIL